MSCPLLFCLKPYAEAIHHVVCKLCAVESITYVEEETLCDECLE